jgi:hypothetical protein
MKSGCNDFFHLTPLGDSRYASAALGEAVRLGATDVEPLLASLKEARAPAIAEPRRVLFRPSPTTPSAAARANIARGEGLQIHTRPTCAARSSWWQIAPGRAAAPVLYPAKIGARAFAFLNERRLAEDKKWHALFPIARAGDPGIPAWLLGLVLSATPVRLAIDTAARPLTGAQAIADLDCRVLARAPFPTQQALARLLAPLARCQEALARDPVSTDLPAMLDRPAQRELDDLVARALGLPASEPAVNRRALLARVEARLAQAAHIREKLARR